MDVAQLILSITGVCLTGVEVIIIAVATVLAVSQLRENTRVRQAEILGRLFEYVSSQEVRDARRRARSIDLPNDLSQLSSDQKDDIELTLVGWARVGVLLDIGLFSSSKDENKLFKTYSWSIDNSWERLKRYVLPNVQLFLEKPQFQPDSERRKADLLAVG